MTGDGIPQRTYVFFYGLFMDPDLLEEKGLAPQNIEIGSVQGRRLRIGDRAFLVSEGDGRVYGTIMSLTRGELERLYSEPGLQAYRPQAVHVDLQNGVTMAALCYNLPKPDVRSEPNPEYLRKLLAVAQKV